MGNVHKITKLSQSWVDIAFIKRGMHGFIMDARILQIWSQKMRKTSKKSYETVQRDQLPLRTYHMKHLGSGFRPPPPPQPFLCLRPIGCRRHYVFGLSVRPYENLVNTISQEPLGGF